MAAYLSLSLIISWLFLLNYVQGDVVLQSDDYCRSGMNPAEERILDQDEFDIFSHTGRVDYSPNKNCIVTIIGKTYYQWEITLTNLDIDKFVDECRDSRPPCCNDYLKIFNSYRVDNARLFPSIPWRGLCGSELPRQVTFTSTQNYITIQFRANPVGDYMRGFSLHVRQYPRRNSGTEFSQTGYIGGWNDGTLTELQIDWSEQEQIPGDYQPGQDSTFDRDPNGISCYTCLSCKKDYFKTSDIGVTVETGCYVCTKESLKGNAQATRACLSRAMYQEKLRTLRDTSGGETISDFRSCKTFLRGTDSVTYVNLCLCDTNKCNKGHSLKFSWLLSAVMLIVMMVFKY